ncbi:MAG TPA: GH3 auxin-responsive promoter family protein [Balneolaceae bacterium]|nr:GH3 auxin-responsive promoter family protein [Balneolaceae bacterium]
MTLRDWQEEQLFILIRAATDTEFGKKHHFSNLQRYEDYAEEVPISFYSDIANRVRKLKEGATDIFWPGKVNRFAVSAGTSGTGKHLPVTEDRQSSDRRFMRNIAWNYIKQHPNIFRLWGNHISLPGTLEKETGLELGEISAFTARQIPWWLKNFQLIPTEELIQIPFSQKIERIIEKSVAKDIRVITAVPSWLLTIFQRVLQKTNANSIAEVWPGLKLLVCGGVKLANYRSRLEKLLGMPNIDFIETYGASEGYFSYTDNLQKKDMKLVVDNGVFYEFIPNPLPDQNSLSIQETIPLWQVEPDTPYAMLVSTNAGLWRYAMNDIITFTETNPPRIKVAGRVNEMLDDYGEALYIYKAEQTLHEISRELDVEIGTYSIAAQLPDGQDVPNHLWFIQAYEPLHTDTLQKLANRLDHSLQKQNRHYQIRRESNALGMPKLYSISQQQINNWLDIHGKHKAQGKLPHILRDNEDIDFFKR